MKLLLLPGFDGSGQLFTRFVSALPASIEPIIVSYPLEGPQTYERFYEIARGLIPDSPYTVLGESFGGPLGFLLALNEDQNLQAIILSASFIRNPRPFLTGLVRPFLKPHHFKKGITPAWYIRRLLLNGVDDNKLVADIQQATARMPANVYYERLRAVAEVDVRQLVYEFSKPVMYLRAQNDRVIRPSAMNDLLKLKPQTNVSNFFAPHMLLQTVPHETSKVVVEFMRKNATTLS